MKLATIANGIGKGVLAGVAGTTAMTLSSTVEAKLRGRAFSSAPADAAAKLLGIKEFESEAAKARFSNLVHWGYGTGCGVARGALRAFGVSSAASTPAHFLSIWGSALFMLPALDVAPPAWTWRKEDLAIDVFHHAVYVTATAYTYEWLDSQRRGL